MSVSEILVPNTYDLFADSIITNFPNVNSTSFSGSPVTTTAVTIGAPLRVLYSNSIIANSAYNGTNYIVPVAGQYHFSVGAAILLGNSASGSDVVTMTVKLMSGATTLQTVTSIVNLAASASYQATIPLNYFGNFAQAAVVGVDITITQVGGPLTQAASQGPGSWLNVN